MPLRGGSPHGCQCRAWILLELVAVAHGMWLGMCGGGEAVRAGPVGWVSVRASVMPSSVLTWTQGRS